MPVIKDKSTIRTHESGAAARSKPEIDSAKNDGAAALLLRRAAKRSFDIIVATIGLILFSPIFLLSSLAIWIHSREPVFRRHLRHGCNGKEILVLKFPSNEITGRAKNSSRMAHVGRILRSSGIDGLPQLINVLRGEMSIVGLSPYVAAPNNILAEDILHIQRRHRVKPGIIGWAQVNGCWGESNTRDVTRRRIEYDRYYIDNWSFLFDIKIILMNLFSKDSYSNR